MCRYDNCVEQLSVVLKGSLIRQSPGLAKVYGFLKDGSITCRYLAAIGERKVSCRRRPLLPQRSGRVGRVLCVNACPVPKSDKPSSSYISL